MKKNVLWIALAVVLVIGAGVGGYFLGMDAGKTQAASVRTQFMAERFGDAQPGGQGTFVIPPGTGSGNAPGGFSGRAGMGTTGTIKEIRGDTVILSTAEKEVKVKVAADTRITLSAQGSISDLKVGDRIIASGETSGDQVTATQIQVISQIP